MDRFYREKSIKGISPELAIILGKELSAKEEYAFLGEHIDKLENLDRYSDNRERIKFWVINTIIYHSMVSASENIHDDFQSYYLENIGRLEKGDFLQIIKNLKYVSDNYVANACDSITSKHTEYPETYSGVLSTRLEYVDGLLRLEVEDNGKGIDKAVEHLIFSSNIKSKKYNEPVNFEGILHGGCGIGLRQTRQWAKYIGAKVGYHNKGLDKGATFWYELPLK
jgi:hypothetical protein